MLRTRAPVSSQIAPTLPLDLHVLGLPLAFILSQDQTLHSKSLFDPASQSILLIVWVAYLFLTLILSKNFINFP